jgi:quinol monooxygenase YgiN
LIANAGEASQPIIGSEAGAPSMVGGLKTLKVRDGHEGELERLFGELREIMRAQEPGCLLYSLLKSRTTKGAYIVQEQYRDVEALDAHQNAPYGALYYPKMRAILESIIVEYFDGVVD